MKKKYFYVILALVALLVLASCKAGNLSVTMSFDPISGEGEKTFRVSVAKNDVPDVGNNFGEGGYTPDTEALAALFEDVLPDFVEIELEDIVDEVYMPGPNIQNAVVATSVSASSVTVEWKKPVANEIGTPGGYVLNRYAKNTDQGDEGYVAAGEHIFDSADTLTFTDTDLETGKVYKYNITAVVDVEASPRVIVTRLDGKGINPEEDDPDELDGDPIESNPAILKDLGSIDYLISFEFNGIDDYNAKMKEIVTEGFWDNYNTSQAAAYAAEDMEWENILPATLGVEEEEDQTTYTFTEDARVTLLVANFLADVCLNDDTGAWVDTMGGSYTYSYGEIVTPAGGDFTLTFGENTESFSYNEVDFFEMSAVYKNEGGGDEDGNDESPKTGPDAIAVTSLFGLMISAAALMFSKKK